MSAYPNYYQQSYQSMNQPQGPYQPQAMQVPQYQMPQAAPQQSSSGIVWVQGEAGAKSYLVAPGQSVLLMDSEVSAFYIKSSDPSGMPLPLRIFDYTERNTVQTVPSAVQNSGSVDLTKLVTREELEEKIALLASQISNASKSKEEITNG